MRWGPSISAAALALGCAPMPPAAAPALPSRVAAMQASAAVVVAPPVEPAPAAPPASTIAAPSPAAALAEPRAHLEIERPFRLDLRVVPRDHAVFLTELRDRERWNKGDLGELAKPAPPVPGHPMPKVIVDVLSAKGGHKASDVQRDARRLFWIRVVSCYGTGAYKDQKLRGATKMRVQVSRAGKVTSSRVVETSLKDPDVARCLAEEIQKVPLPKARSSSILAMEVQIGPGDEPMPPPPAMLTPGEGTIDPAAVAEVVRARAPELEACYAAALDYAPRLWGRLGVRFHLTEKGKLDEAFEAETRFPDERVTLCVLRIARGLTFPKPKGGEARFVVPLRFSTDRAP